MTTAPRPPAFFDMPEIITNLNATGRHPLRSHPQQRDWLFGLYQQALADAGVTPLLLAGTRRARLAAVWRALQPWLPQLPNF